MKRKLVILGLILALAALPLAAACAKAPTSAPAPAPTVTVTVAAPAPAPTPTPTPAPAKVYEWKYFDAFGSANWVSWNTAEFVKALEKATNGQIKVKVYFAGEHPFKMFEILNAVSTRQAELGLFVGTFVMGQNPLLGMTSMPLIIPDPPDFANIYEIEKALDKEFFANILGNQFGTSFIQSYMSPAMEFTARAPATSRNAFAGKRIRVSSAEIGKLVEYLGGVGVTMDFAEVPSALATGALDGLNTMLVAIRDSKLYKNVNYSTLFGTGYNTEGVIANNKALAELPPELRDIVLKVADEWAWKIGYGYWSANNDAIRDMVQRGLLTVVAADPAFRKETADYAKKNLLTDWLKKAGPDGQRALDLIDSISAKWKLP
ncbi:MAG: TRAP transporter substrate-binding protein DctP [Chloroflexi bacterium]|nr:TRAP transporter substrate-binding protein DctP [Chloroflexota bacterium]